jgi:hypothetical protein
VQLSPRSQNNQNNILDNPFRQKSAEYLNQPVRQDGWIMPPQGAAPLPVTQAAAQLDPSLSEILRRPPVGTSSKAMPLNRSGRLDTTSKINQYPELMMGLQPLSTSNSNLNYNTGKILLITIKSSLLITN